MGAGQIGGIATLVDMDFQNAATFLGVIAEPTEAQYIVHYLSHAMMFCLGVIIEAHVVLTPASCVHGEINKFNVIAGTHEFLENAGAVRMVHHLCTHRGYNTSNRWADCTTDNMALLILDQQFSFNKHEPGTSFLLNRVRYGSHAPKDHKASCRYYGWGSRRNGYLIPLLIHLRRMDVTILPKEKCLAMFNYEDHYLCIHQPQCRSSKFGALCPDDIGSVIVCGGFVQGMMVSRIVDRPCGVGFLDLSHYGKFLTCGVDDSRDVIDSGDGDGRFYDFNPYNTNQIPVVQTLPPENYTSVSTENQEEAPKETPNDPGQSIDSSPNP